MRLNYDNWSASQIPHPKEGIWPAAVTAAFVIGAWAFHKYVQPGDTYVVRVRDYRTPSNTVAKMPGIYITKEMEDEEDESED